MITRLPRLLIAAAGLASLAYVAIRARAPATHTRRLSLASLDADLGNWLPKLPYLPFIHIEIPGTGDSLRMSGDAGMVNIDLPPPAAGRADLLAAFRRACDELGFEARKLGPEGGLRCRLPADAELVAPVLAALLRELYDVDPDTTLIAAVPSRG